MLTLPSLTHMSVHFVYLTVVTLFILAKCYMHVALPLECVNALAVYVRSSYTHKHYGHLRIIVFTLFMPSE